MQDYVYLILPLGPAKGPAVTSPVMAVLGALRSEKIAVHYPHCVPFEEINIFVR